MNEQNRRPEDSLDRLLEGSEQGFVPAGNQVPGSGDDSFEPDFGNAFDDYGDYEEPAQDEQLPPAPVRRRFRIKKIRFPKLIKIAIYLAVTVAIGVLCAKVGWKMADDVLALTRPNQDAEVIINENDNLDDIAASLKQAGLIEYEWLFKLYCKVTGSEHYFDPGNYTVNMTYDYHAIVNSLMASAGRRETITLMIVEGANSYEIFDLLEKNGVCSKERLEEACAQYKFDYDFLRRLPYGANNRLEGYLFPDTYEFYLKDDPENVLARLLRNFNVKMDDEYMDAVNESGYSLQQILTLASIVEAEAANDDERGKIASVMYNRLNNWSDKMLGMDSTVYYGAMLLGESFSTNLDSPYNTYRYPGIPKGPICNPGMNSIRAVLYPEDTNYYYFATGVDGVNHFFETQEGFEEFINSDQYQDIIPAGYADLAPAQTEEETAESTEAETQAP